MGVSEVDSEELQVCMILTGLTFNFVGTVLLGATSQFGIVAGFGDPTVWKTHSWGVADVFG
jgi:hypothetical protein